MNKLTLSLLSISLTVAFTSAEAATVTWADWTTNTSATIGTVDVTYSGELSGLSALNYPSWTPSSTFADGVIVSNAPPPSGRMVQLFGGGGTGAVTDTLTFSAPVIDPVFAIWSLGPSPVASFVFDATPTFVAGGASAEYGGNPITVSGNVVSGFEGNGTVQFLGTFTSLSWTNPAREAYYGFTVGVPVAAIPEPEIYALMLVGLSVIGFVGRSRNRKLIDV